MDCNEFISSMKSHGALFAPPAPQNAVILANNALQNIHAAILPKFIIELYTKCSAINLGNGYIFGPTEVKRGTHHPIPSIVQINSDLSSIPSMRGKTIFGRNDLFWFGFDTFGNCFMLDNLNLNILRKYDNPWQSVTDCLLAGKL